MYGTPVLGVDIGGIPELIRVGETGELFESGNAQQMGEQILALWMNPEQILRYSKNCNEICFASAEQYAEELIEKIYLSK